MASYVDGFIVPVPKKKIEAYRRMALKAGKIWREHGALQYRECIADDVKWGKRTSFPRSVKLKGGEVVWFSWIVYKSRKHRDSVNKKVMKGAQYAWEGNKDVGQGRMEIAESVPPSKVAIKLDFVKPFEAHNTIEFTLEPKGEATNVTWAMQGDTPYLAKIVHVFLDMDKMVGKDFEAGLANLRAAAAK